MSAEMPKPVATSLSSGITNDLIRVRVRPNSSVDVGQKLYTADQMREFANEASRLAMERCIAAIAACRPAEPNDVWEGAFQHVCDENIAAIRALSDMPAQEKTNAG